jgi:hypothetical protein
MEVAQGEKGITRMSDTDQLRAFYLDGERSIFHIWEDGGARGDAVTPSTYSAAYRRWMSGLLRGFLAESPDPGLLSVGCGNAVIEAELAAEGFRVLGVDALEEAVELAGAKGVDAVRADILTWTPPPGPWTVLYADGILGHLYEPGTGVRHVLERFRSWLPEGGTLVISNDPPRTAAELEPNHNVPGYFWLSHSYLHRQAEEAGFRDVSSSLFGWDKPLTGPRERAVVTARA